MKRADAQKLFEENGVNWEEYLDWDSQSYLPSLHDSDGDIIFDKNRIEKYIQRIKNQSIGDEMKKEKVLLYVIKPVTLTYITGELAEYTKYNGCYPDFIDMPEDVWEVFQSLFVNGQIDRFRGIPVRKTDRVAT